jgi:hypothetical protein
LPSPSSGSDGSPLALSAYSTPDSSATSPAASAENSTGCCSELGERDKANELAGSHLLDAGKTSHAKRDPTVDHTESGDAGSSSPSGRRAPGSATAADGRRRRTRARVRHETGPILVGRKLDKRLLLLLLRLLLLLLATADPSF